MKLNIHLNESIFYNKEAMELLEKLTNLPNVPSDSFHLLVKDKELKSENFPDFLKERCEIIIWDKKPKNNLDK